MGNFSVTLETVRKRITFFVTLFNVKFWLQVTSYFELVFQIKREPALQFIFIVMKIS